MFSRFYKNNNNNNNDSLFTNNNYFQYVFLVMFSFVLSVFLYQQCCSNSNIGYCSFILFISQGIVIYLVISSILYTKNHNNISNNDKTIRYIIDHLLLLIAVLNVIITFSKIVQTKHPSLQHKIISRHIITEPKPSHRFHKPLHKHFSNPKKQILNNNKKNINNILQNI
jgi:uncharacterized membrane protein YdjX (TVP38/TMEM64 family)